MLARLSSHRVSHRPVVISRSAGCPGDGMTSRSSASRADASSGKPPRLARRWPPSGPAGSSTQTYELPCPGAPRRGHREAALPRRPGTRTSCTHAPWCDSSNQFRLHGTRAIRPHRARSNVFWPHRAGAGRHCNFPGRPLLLGAKDRSRWGRNLFADTAGGAKRTSSRGAGASSRNHPPGSPADPASTAHHPAGAAGADEEAPARRSV